MKTYDEWKSTEPDDPYADELELERRDAEMGEDEPAYNWRDYAPDDDELECKARCEDGPEADFWSGLNDEADDINIITGEVEE